MNYSDSVLRLKYCLRVSKDQEVAAALGLSKTALSQRKRLNSFPEKDLRALAQQRPELGIDVGYVLTGKPTQAAVADFEGLAAPQAPSAEVLTDAELNVSYKLARHVPDMARGFTIHTNFGELPITNPRLAQRIQALVRNALVTELAILGKRRQ